MGDMMYIELWPKNCVKRIAEIYALAYDEEMKREGIIYNLNCFLKNKNSICIIASVENGLDVGFVLGNVYYYYDTTFAKIDEICVTKKHQHSGIGKILLREFEKLTALHNVSCIYFEQYKDEKLDNFYSGNNYIVADDKEFRYKRFD